VGSWGFIGLAYGVGSATLVVYLILLGRRLREAADELAVLEQTEERTRR
jgi:hypothetical protein